METDVKPRTFAFTAEFLPKIRTDLKLMQLMKKGAAASLQQLPLAFGSADTNASRIGNDGEPCEARISSVRLLGSLL